MSIFRSELEGRVTALVKDLNEAKPHLAKAGYAIEEKPPADMLGIQVERLRAHSSKSSPVLAFGGEFFHVVQAVGLSRAITSEEALRFNASTQVFNLIASDEPLAGFLKAHIPAKFGIPPEMILSMLRYSEEVTDKLVAVVGRENVRDL